MIERFDSGGAFRIPPSRTKPILNRRPGESCLFIVKGQEFRFQCDPLGEPTLQCFGDSSMEKPPRLLRQGTVGGFLDEGMLKVVGRIGNLTLLKYQPGCDEEVEGMPQTVDTVKEIPETLKRNEENR